jgi:peptidyl-prolyl cis-trans isomerase C
MRRVFFLSVLLATGLYAWPDTRAQDALAGGTPRDEVVARVGPAQITVRDLEERIAELPPFQRASYGATPDAVRRRFLTEILVPETLLSLGGEARNLSAEDRTAYDIERARSSATLRALRERIGPAAAIPMSDVQKYYDENRARYDTPERYQLWRILCPTQESAVRVLEESKRDPSIKNFGDLAREHSLDKATNLRSGNLGFLTAEGLSSEPGLRVDPAIVRAAQGVRDGELVPVPVAEGEYFAVVWRRGTIPANKHPVEAVAAQIRDAIWKARVKKGTDELVARLRTAKLRDLDDGLLEAIELPPESAAGSEALPESLRPKGK